MLKLYKNTYWQMKENFITLQLILGISSPTFEFQIFIPFP
jgi:hypothetical protein